MPLSSESTGASNHGAAPLVQDAIACLRHVPVLIVGGGPTGLLMAHMLSKLGVQSLLVEKYPTRLDAPKAHALSPRSLEICRQFGLDTNAVRKIGSSRADAYWVNFLTDLSGERIGVLPYERMDKEVLDLTPEMIHNIPQPEFESLLAKELADDPNVQIVKGIAFVNCDTLEDEVICALEQRSTKRQFTVRARHLVACDGARSQVRKDLGIQSEGEDGYETMMTIHFKANLRSVVGDRVGMLHWITDPACSGFIIAYDLDDNQVLISNFDSELHPQDTWTEELARSTVASAIGQSIPIEIHSFRPWLLSRKVAKEYSRGNVFLVGDAAHSFPPTGGLGLNSGIADAHNLAYKIAAVHQGWADPSILISYGEERRPIALINSEQSVKNGKKIFSFLKTLGTAGIKDVQKARENLHKSIHDPSKQEMINQEVEGQREHFNNLELHIGYVYGDKKAPANASDFQPKFVPGARLPHAWIRPLVPTTVAGFSPIDVSYVTEYSQMDISRRQYSTLDLARMDSFALIVKSQAVWEERFKEVRLELSNLEVKVKLWSADTDFEFVYAEGLELFNKELQSDNGWAILVRPDQRILACFALDTLAQNIVSVVRESLGL